MSFSGAAFRNQPRAGPSEGPTVHGSARLSAASHGTCRKSHNSSIAVCRRRNLSRFVGALQVTRDVHDHTIRNAIPSRRLTRGKYACGSRANNRPVCAGGRSRTSGRARFLSFRRALRNIMMPAAPADSGGIWAESSPYQTDYTNEPRHQQATWSR
jgi:hypothetical protein